METARSRVCEALLRAADQLERGAPYQWGHVGQCNVGHVVQHLALMSDREIMAAFGRTLTQWREHAAEYFDAAIGDEPLATTESQQDYCSERNIPLEQVYRLFAVAGLRAEDIGHMEFLSDPAVLARLHHRRLHRNNPADVARYLRTYAQLLAERSGEENCTASAAYICA